MSEAKGPGSDTPPCAADSRKGMAEVFPTRVGERMQAVVGIDVMLFHKLPRKLAEEPTPSLPL